MNIDRIRLLAIWYTRAIVIAFLVTASLATCIRVGVRDIYSPVYLEFADLRAQIASTEPVEMRETGKIYVKDDMLYVNERETGIHVIDNSDPSSPESIAFIPIPGNVDIAIFDNVLYADSYVDLVAIDISDPTAAVELSRVEDAFPYQVWAPGPIGFGLWGDDIYEAPDHDLGIVVGWEKTDSEVYFADNRVLYDVLAGTAEGASGTGGSLARFTIVDSWLYTLHGGSMNLYSLAEPSNPTPGNVVEIGWDIETIFPYGNLLFIGSMSGMYIYDNSSPAAPTQLSRFAHVTSCDPVVVSGDRAYVTLRSGAICGGGVDQLDIINISDLENPVLISTFAMDEPHGLGVDGDTLFVCDGASGLKIYDASSGSFIELIASIADITAIDVILLPPVAIVVGPGGIDQYDYSDLSNITLLSHLDIVTPVE